MGWLHLHLHSFHSLRGHGLHIVRVKAPGIFLLSFVRRLSVSQVGSFCAYVESCIEARMQARKQASKHNLESKLERRCG